VSLADLRRAAELLPPGSAVTVPREALLAAIDTMTAVTATPATESLPTPWQVRLWSSPADARMTVADVADALSRPKSWVYRHTSPASGLPRLPHRKLDGELTFLVGEVRQWIEDHEDVVVAAARAIPILQRARHTGPLSPSTGKGR
jgi:hypothetical protein